MSNNTNKNLNDLSSNPTEKEVKEAERKADIDKNINNVVSEKDKANFKKLMEEAKQPIVVRDGDFKMGEKELDIRNLSPKNYRQLMFRLKTIEDARLLSIDQSLLDITRLLITLLARDSDVKGVLKEFSDATKGIMEEAKKIQ